MLDALSPQRRRVVLAGAGVVALLLVALVATLVVRAVRPAASVPQDQPGPVLLVPGYGGDGSSLQPLAQALRDAGRTAVVVPEVGDGTGDLDAQAVALAAVAERVREEFGATSVDVVGYSAGGVVARLWVRDHGGDAVARRVLTLGSPHHGTTQAALGASLAGGCPPACEQLVPGSELLRRLNARDETPAGPAWVTLRSTADQVVTPVDSAALDGALDVAVQDLCPAATTSHAGLPADPVTRALVGSALGAGPPALPSAVRC
ncbi:lipase family alpha/beta hydrolase [Microlunatus capsulatus]|uniref:Pimeloyl-ACP methyl ester carboxylesterase n=1 Tax=Microlunatus capsulatus TaxID=99117 RepID=A0ABS4Z6W5_9ACTN|nr:alpha/beta fold hydrolase [Microlunatus capsulatus]MBP2416782.1 pimeloyl-ACP methyl ester carboxylesterase [Microlunatus capsulatus]